MANSKKKKEPDNTVKFIAGALGGGFGALIAGPLGAAVERRLHTGRHPS